MFMAYVNVPTFLSARQELCVMVLVSTKISPLVRGNLKVEVIISFFSLCKFECFVAQ